jgi:hypothetical protein
MLKPLELLYVFSICLCISTIHLVTVCMRHDTSDRFIATASVLLVEGTRVPTCKQWPVASQW